MTSSRWGALFGSSPNSLTVAELEAQLAAAHATVAWYVEADLARLRAADPVEAEALPWEDAVQELLDYRRAWDVHDTDCAAVEAERDRLAKVVEAVEGVCARLEVANFTPEGFSATFSFTSMVRAALADAPQRDGGKVWCETCEHEHIAPIPTVTYLCHECGFGQWTSHMAEQHRAQTGHRTYRQGHVLSTRPAPQPEEIAAPCPTCSGPTRETVGMVCQTCGTDYAPQPEKP